MVPVFPDRGVLLAVIDFPVKPPLAPHLPAPVSGRIADYSGLPQSSEIYGTINGFPKKINKI